MRISSSLFSSALYLGLAAAAAISNAADITSRDVAGSGGSAADDLAGAIGTAGGSLGVALLPSSVKDAAIKAAGGNVPEDTGSGGTDGLADGLAQAGGTAGGSAAKAILPGNTVDNGIKAAGGSTGDQ
ncbi:hypothetical protein OG21DRAFT_1508197 [Imleria badia]|nr:hypothetical protein OG21DRAFT_1508197 [Imleria badia]